ncbi:MULTISPECIES: plastocyanin/azurin family copper-binding protein [unclassified Ruegeria]|uniref:cupredoxin domain-containing protein n=1 Tax=unclassified Ruegeria TaxID=2625375 RepID=UPI001490CBAC|nr:MULTISPECIES: plastocyanin/azurin family copper-binding protein [unclassified Ruegeria]NOC45315.1 copper-binding protein [Ruegeria sp. HKCCD7559]NOD84935.1 copper-binding protein [Ruegeria sp. HKCCD6119]
MKPLRLLPALLLLAAPAWADETAEICAEAEERYVELFGQPSSAVEDAEVVLMYKYNFCPSELTVKAGTTVRWVNVDKRTSHSVLLKDGSQPESDRLFPEESVELTFLTPGPQDYLCGPHWETQNMIGMITVEP